MARAFLLFAALSAGCFASPSSTDAGRRDTHSTCSDGPSIGCLCFTADAVACVGGMEIRCMGGSWRDAMAPCGLDAGPIDAPPFDAPMDDTPPDPLGFGEVCTGDAQCASGDCWDFGDIDPYCHGRGCTIACTTDAECQDAARDAGAPTPDMATCSPVRGCDLQLTGLFAVYCE